MSEKSRLQQSLHRLIKRRGNGDDESRPGPVSWFQSEVAGRGRLDLSRAGEEQYLSRVLDARTEEDGELVLIVDRLMPRPDDEFWHQPVSLDGTLTTFDAGMEEIASFRAMVGERIDIDGQPAVELRQVRDLERNRREYLAPIASGHAVTLSFVWYNSWIDVKPTRLTIKRFYFHTQLEDFSAPDGYALPKAMLKLGKGGTPIPVKLQLERATGGEFVATLETIDGVGRQKLTDLVEEIWRTEAGLSRRRAESSEPEVGYMVRPKDEGNGSTGPAVIYAGDDDHWVDLLGEVGEVMKVTGHKVDTLSETLAEYRCDLFVGDADLWRGRAVSVERLLRSVSRYRDIPRVWITGEQVGQPWEESDVILGEAPGEEATASGEVSDADALDHVDYGAFDLMQRDIDDDTCLRRLRWALGGDAIGRGEGVLLVTQDARLRYRMGLSVLEESGVRFVVFDRVEGLLPALDKRRPRWILLDATSFEVEIDTMLARAADWARNQRANVIVLARGVGPDRVTHWLKHGARDIILLDPSLREAMRRLRQRVLHLA